MLSENIKTLRKQKGYSQETLAQELNVVRQTVSKWEKGYSVPDALMVEKLAELFEVPVGDLLGNEEKAPDYKSELEQLTAQLAILNDQYARELERKNKWMKFSKAALLPVLAVFFLCVGTVIGMTCCMTWPMGTEAGYGDVGDVRTHPVASELFAGEDIEAAAEAVKEYFFLEFEGCTLYTLYYAGDERSKLESEYSGSETLVLMSSFYVDSSGGDGSFNADCTYDGWSWMLEKTDDGKWEVVNYGYA